MEEEEEKKTKKKRTPPMLLRRRKLRQRFQSGPTARPASGTQGAGVEEHTHKKKSRVNP
jgi:hypothetical protein